MESYLELHIEQGPVLEAEGKTVGIVTGAQGIRWYDLSVRGQEVHAGPFPMNLRRDPTSAMSRLIDGVMAIGTSDDQARAKIGQLQALPGSRNVVPGRINLSLDLRHPDEERLSEMHGRLETLLEELATACSGLTFECRPIWHSPVVAFDQNLVERLSKGTRAHGYGGLEMISGAGHDALMVARKVPTTMIFIPCRDGLSHNEAEYAEPSHVEAVANVLLWAVSECLGVN